LYQQPRLFFFAIKNFVFDSEAFVSDTIIPRSLGCDCRFVTKIIYSNILIAL